MEDPSRQLASRKVLKRNAAVTKKEYHALMCDARNMIKNSEILDEQVSV